MPWDLALGLALLAAVLRWPSLGLPLDGDEGVYATLALAWHKGWGLPYRDLFDHKPPLLYAVYALAFKLGGWRPEALRLFSLLWQAMTTALFGALVFDWTRDKATAWAGGMVWAALSAAWCTQAAAANAEGWGWLPLLMGLACLRPLDGGRASWRWVAWGVFAGVACQLKQPFYLLAGGLPLCLEAGWSARGRALLGTATGLLLAHAPVMAWLAFHGDLGPWWWAVFVFNGSYANFFSANTFKGAWRLARFLAAEQGGFWALGLLALWPWHRVADDRRLLRLGLTFAAWGWLASALSGRWYPHYAVLWHLGLALLVVAAFRAPWPPAGRWARWALLSLALLIHARAQAVFWALPSGAARSQRLYGTDHYGQAPALAEWIRAHSADDDRLLVWGADPELYFLAQRRPAGHALNNFGLTGVTPSWPGAEEECMAAVADPRCRVVVVAQALDPAQAFQKRLGAELGRQFEFHRDASMQSWVGSRRP